MAHPITKTGTGFTYELLRAELDLGQDEKKSFNKFLTALGGDFWQNGKGTLLPEASARYSKTINALFEIRYVTRNIMQEGVSRVSSAFLGRSPNWSYMVDGVKIDLNKLRQQQKNIKGKLDLETRRTAALQANVAQNTPPPVPLQPGLPFPRPVPQPQAPAPEPGVPPPTPDQSQTIEQEAKQIAAQLKDAEFLDEMDKLLSESWTMDGIADVMIKAFEIRLAAGRGGLRAFVPAKFKNGKAFKNLSELAKAVKAVECEYISPTQSRLLRDEGELFSIIQYAVRKDWLTAEFENRIEFSFIDDEGKTFIGVLKENSEQAGIPTAGGENLSQPLMLDENTTYFEFKGEPYLSDQVFKNNQGVNLSLTCGGFNVVENGFRQMVLTNVDLETEEIEDPDSETGVREVPKKIETGGGVVNNFLGLEMTDLTTGQENRLTPGVHVVDPSPMTSFKDAYDMYYAACLAEMGQLYALIAGDAAASGEARIQAMADFYLRIRRYKSEVDKIGSQLMTVILRLAATLAGKEAQFENVSVIFDSKLKIGQLSAADRQIVLTMRKDGIISFETARVLLEIDDPVLEEELIQNERDKEALLNPVPSIIPQNIVENPANVKQGVGPGQPGKTPGVI